MNQLHITLEENSPAIKWANTQADRIGARGHVGTHLDCYTTVPEKPEYNITAMVLDCQNEMPKEEDIKSLTTLEIWLYCYIQPIWRETNTERICISPQKPF